MKKLVLAGSLLLAAINASAGVFEEEEVILPPSRHEPTNESIPLPGIKAELPGKPKALPKDNTVWAREGKTENVAISSLYANRISTPYLKPAAVAPDWVSVKPMGNSLYVTAARETPFAMYITSGTDPNAPVISMFVVPQKLPPQTIMVQLDDKQRLAVGGKTKLIEKPTSYEAFITKVFKEIALNMRPAGFSESKMTGAIAKSGSLLIQPSKRYSSSVADVFVYQVTNIDRRKVMVEESLFYEPGVRAVAVWPDGELEPKATTTVMVMAGGTNE